MDPRYIQFRDELTSWMVSKIPGCCPNCCDGINHPNGLGEFIRGDPIWETKENGVMLRFMMVFEKDTFLSSQLHFENVEDFENAKNSMRNSL